MTLLEKKTSEVTPFKANVDRGGANQEKRLGGCA